MSRYEEETEPRPMPVTWETVTIYECNNPDCGSSVMRFTAGNCINCYEPLVAFAYVWDKSVAYAIEQARREGFEMAKEKANAIIFEEETNGENVRAEDALEYVRELVKKMQMDEPK